MTEKTALLARLAGRLIVSCQPVIDGPMDHAEIVVAFARAALIGGGAGIRVQGVRDTRAVAAAIEAPVIGLIKRVEPGSAIIITPQLADVAALAEAGAQIIAFDATLRPRPVPVAELIAATHARGCLAMADCATLADAEAALAAGADILGTTLAGYTGGPVPVGPDLDFVRAASRLAAPVYAEGRYNSPAAAAAAIAAGADAVVVGSAITRTEHVTQWFADAIRDARK